MRSRMDVRDRYEQDSAFHTLVDMLEAFLWQHPHYTPSELREAAMLAALRVEAMMLRPLRTDNFGNIIKEPERFR